MAVRLRIFEVQDWSKVQIAVASMAVHRISKRISLQQRRQIDQEFREHIRVDRAIFDERNRLLLALNLVQNGGGSLSHTNDPFNLLFVG